MLQLKDFNNALISLYNVDYDNFVKITGFSKVGGYADDKWDAFSKDHLYEFLNYDDGIKQSFIDYFMFGW